MRKRKMVTAFLLILSMGVIFTACGSKTVTTTDKDGKTGLDRLVSYFQDNGLIIGEKYEKAYSMVGAKGGFALEVEGSKIELYQFDLENATDEAKQMLDSAKTNGKTSFFGTELNAISNNDLLLINYDDNSQKDKIIELFKKFE
jgi:hypothetical protein